MITDVIGTANRAISFAEVFEEFCSRERPPYEQVDRRSVLERLGVNPVEERTKVSDALRAYECEQRGIQCDYIFKMIDEYFWRQNVRRVSDRHRSSLLFGKPYEEVDKTDEDNLRKYRARRAVPEHHSATFREKYDATLKPPPLAPKESSEFEHMTCIAAVQRTFDCECIGIHSYLFPEIPVNGFWCRCLWYIFARQEIVDAFIEGPSSELLFTTVDATCSRYGLSLEKKDITKQSRLLYIMAIEHARSFAMAITMLPSHADVFLRLERVS